MLIEDVSEYDADSWRWPHFTPKELACRCGGRFCAGEYWHAPDSLGALEALRAGMGHPLVINSGHRCAVWNTYVGGALFSFHRSIAVDISLAGHDRHALLAAAERLGFTGFCLVGTAIGPVAGRVEARQAQAHERARWARKTEMQKLRTEADGATREADLRQTKASFAWAGLSASVAVEAATGERYKWVNAVRALTRPSLTVLQWGITGAVFLVADEAGQAGIVDTATIAATAATLWWFGDRGARREMR